MFVKSDWVLLILSISPGFKMGANAGVPDNPHSPFHTVTFIATGLIYTKIVKKATSKGRCAKDWVSPALNPRVV
jgi:hypothetical protein